MNDNEKPGTTPQTPEPASGPDATLPLANGGAGFPGAGTGAPQASPGAPTEPISPAEPTEPIPSIATTPATSDSWTPEGGTSSAGAGSTLPDVPADATTTPATPLGVPHAGTQPYRGPAAAAAEPSHPTPSPRPVSRLPRVRTIVWGFIVIALGTAVIAVSLGADVDFALVAIGVLGLAGLTLVIGSVASASRRREKA